MRTRAKVDTTQAEIVLALRQVGAVVTSLASVGKGVSDLLVSFRARWYVLEVKSPGGQLEDDQWEWIGRQRAEVHVVTTVEDALRAIGVTVSGLVPGAGRAHDTDGS